jgi:hypothetical protein
VLDLWRIGKTNLLSELESGFNSQSGSPLSQPRVLDFPRKFRTRPESKAIVGTRIWIQFSVWFSDIWTAGAKILRNLESLAGIFQAAKFCMQVLVY